ncbi:MAG TPA: dienelactone hydrolase family protein [Alphaproteobacteria bacterium]|nr:dienelactone hydrolase family protein [Alphaproteobacteria bacterium]
MSDIVSRDVTCGNGMPGYLALPPGSGKVPGVIILHERYGYVQHPRDVADRFARLGMAGFAINGFFNCDFQPALADGTKRFHFTDPQSVEYVRAAIRTMTEEAPVDRSKIALLGMCQTGRHPLVMAAQKGEIAAAICWYGAGANREFEAGPLFPRPLGEVIADIDCPVLGLFGEKDNHIPVSNVRRMRDLLEQSGKTFEINVYQGAPHGFLNNTMLERYRHEESESAWRVQMDFLHRAFNGGFDRTRAVQHYAADIAADYRFASSSAHV